MSAWRTAVAGAACAVILAACQTPPTRPVPPESTPAEAAPAAPADIEKTPETRKKPRKPKTPATPPPAVAEVEQPATGAAIFARLVQRFADPPCVEDRVVQRWERLYAGYPPRFAASLEATLPLMAMVLDEIETHGLPAEFALLPIVESWYRPDAAHAGAAGMWQFTAGTAKINGLRVQPGFDERLAPQAATRAAMRYLGLLYNRFGDWKLADMAFNAGDYRLQRAIAKQPDAKGRASAREHLPPGLSMTTYEHLAKIQALACIVAKPEKFKVVLPNPVIDPLRVATVPRGVTSLDAVARQAGMPASALRKLNPAHTHGRIAANAPREILLPATALDRFIGAPGVLMASTAEEPAPVAPSGAAPREYLIKRGDTLSGIAQRLGVKLRDLLAWNDLDVRTLLHPGQRLRLEP